LARAAHALYFQRYAECAEPHLTKEDAQLWLDRLAAEHDNLRAMLDWSAETRSAEAADMGLRTASAMYRYWLVRGRLREGRICIDRALLHPSVTVWNPKLEADARNRAGILAMTQGDTESAEGLYRETLEIRRALGDDIGVARTLSNLAILAANQKRYEDAFMRYEESVRYLRRADDHATMAVLLGNMGALAVDNNDLERAVTYLSESIAINLELKNMRPAAISTLNLGETNFKRGEWRKAESSFLDSLGLFQPLLDVSGCAYALLGLGAVALERGQVRRAKRLIDTAFDAYATIGVPVPTFLEERIAILMAEDGQPSRTALHPKNRDADSAIQALQVLSLIVLDSWEDTGGIREQEEVSQPVKLRLVG
jgi:tetratricopeptide (TPR) repeat protein